MAMTRSWESGYTEVAGVIFAVAAQQLPWVKSVAADAGLDLSVAVEAFGLAG